MPCCQRSLPLDEFYYELVRTQQVLNRKHLGWRAIWSLAGILSHNLARGQTSTLKMLWRFNSVYNPALQLADHHQHVSYEMSPPPESRALMDSRSIYVHDPRGRNGRSIDDDTERFVEQTRMNDKSSV